VISSVKWAPHTGITREQGRHLGGNSGGIGQSPKRSSKGRHRMAVITGVARPLSQRPRSSHKRKVAVRRRTTEQENGGSWSSSRSGRQKERFSITENGVAQRTIGLKRAGDSHLHEEATSEDGRTLKPELFRPSTSLEGQGAGKGHFWMKNSEI